MHVEVEQRARFPSCLVDDEVVKCVMLEIELSLVFSGVESSNSPVG